MSLFGKKRRQVEASALFGSTLLVVWQQIDERCTGVYLPRVETVLATKISDHYPIYVSLLTRLYFSRMLEHGVLRATVHYDQQDFASAWDEALNKALSHRLKDEKSYEASVNQWKLAADEYRLAYEKDRAGIDGRMYTPVFSACEHFVDLVIGEPADNAPNTIRRWTSNRTDVFHIANDMHELVKAACASATDRFLLSGY